MLAGTERSLLELWQSLWHYLFSNHPLQNSHCFTNTIHLAAGHRLSTASLLCKSLLLLQWLVWKKHPLTQRTQPKSEGKNHWEGLEGKVFWQDFILLLFPFERTDSDKILFSLQYHLRTETRVNVSSLYRELQTQEPLSLISKELQRGILYLSLYAHNHIAISLLRKSDFLRRKTMYRSWWQMPVNFSRWRQEVRSSSTSSLR